MPLTAAEIVTLSCQDANCPGYTSQAGQLLNAILAELCQTYDFDIARKTYNFTFDTSVISTEPNAQPGSGPYDLPADYLRMSGGKESRWFLNGVPYPMISIDIEEFDNTVQQAGLQSYPYYYTVDMQRTPPGLVVYPPPSGNYSVSIRYFSQMPDIVTPETSATIPWFVNQTYLRTRLSGELMKIVDDTRANDFLGEGPQGAQGILNRYLKLVNDKSTRAQMVKLDRRLFGSAYSRLPNTKSIGWLFLVSASIPVLSHAIQTFNLMAG